MATRKIIDAKHNGEKVWLKGHAQATYLSNGSTVEDALNSIQFGGIIAETDPIFLASPAASITEAKKTEWDNKMDKVVLSPVAISGNYNDLTNKPTIPASVTESTVSGWGFTKNTGTYSKPTTGIPVSDLAEDIQTALGKANTALQSYTEQYKGTITGVFANGTSIATSGVANIPAASTSKYGVTKLNSATNSTSTTEAATASAVKAAYDLANEKQDKLVSGTNIKTIKGTSILGSGNIAIKDTKNLTYFLNNATSGTVTLLPNVCIYMPNPITGKLAINACSTTSSNNADLIESRICFRIPNNAILPVIQFNGVAIRWAGGNAPTFEADFTYEVSLFYPSNANSVGPMGVCVGFK